MNISKNYFKLLHFFELLHFFQLLHIFHFLQEVVTIDLKLPQPESSSRDLKKKTFSKF